MALRANFSQEEIREKLNQAKIKLDKTIITRLSKLGIEAVNHARNVNSYKDQTGNLRSSIGFMVINHGKIVVKSGFEPVQGKLDLGDHGVTVGEKYITDLAANYPNGYVLVVVAGMKYAAEVEARGLDVLASAELLVEKELPNVWAAIKAQIERRK